MYRCSNEPSAKLGAPVADVSVVLVVGAAELAVSGWMSVVLLGGRVVTERVWRALATLPGVSLSTYTDTHTHTHTHTHTNTHTHTHTHSASHMTTRACQGLVHLQNMPAPEHR